MNRAFYSETISKFVKSTPISIIGQISTNNTFSSVTNQRDAWLEEIQILQNTLQGHQGMIYFELSIPRMGKRIDVILLVGAVIFVLEFKTGESDFSSHAIDQVWDYALDLKNFHEPSHEQYIAPILIAPRAEKSLCKTSIKAQEDKVLFPIQCNTELLGEVIKNVLMFSTGKDINRFEWEKGRYCPTPTIIEAAMALYNNMNVEEISRRDASAINLSDTSEAIRAIVRQSEEKAQKSICFVTGVPGSGKTLVGLDIAAKRAEKSNKFSVFLSGNKPLVDVLREALAQDKIQQAKERNKKLRKGDVRREVKAIIQNIHHFRDECLLNETEPPIDHVVLFDEAQRAWNIQQTEKFMRQKKKRPNFTQSEPEYLISCLDRHRDWAVIVCLVGGGQEINTGEAGISEWIDSLNRKFPDWHIYISPRLTDSEYAAGEALKKLETRPNVFYNDKLHLGVSMRSFRAENVSLLVKQILDYDVEGAKNTLKNVKEKYPIFISRNLSKAKQWLKKKARGSQRYGLVVSSQAERLKPYAVDVRSPMNPIHWFLRGKEDVRSSYYLEDVATEFDIQGLELDWVCIAWDGDFRYTNNGWENWSFCGDRWNRIKKEERRIYQKNAYRVLLTRARQGMVIVIPPGDTEDPTRDPRYYDNTYKYLKNIGFEEI